MNFTTAIAAVALTAAAPVFSVSLPTTTNVPVQMVITARPATLQPGELTVTQGKTPVRVTGFERLDSARSDLQLFILMDDSTRTTSLGIQLPELKKFTASLPPAAQVAAGYMRNGTAAIVQPFTTDHAKAATALRLPEGLAGVNGSPYFALEDLAKHWPSTTPSTRRVVLMLTDGVDRYYTGQIEDDPYVNAANTEALKHGVMVYSIYLRGAGLYGRASWRTTIAQSRLIQSSEETGGYAYFQDFTDPVSIAPFLKDFEDRLANQYLVTISAVNGKGVQPVKMHTETPGVKIKGPTRIYIP